MIDTIMENERLTREAFKLLNTFMLLVWRLGLGPFIQSAPGGYIMVLGTTGHKSGLRRLAPVNFARDGDVVYCLPGFGARTHWYRNLKANPNCEVWLPDGWWTGAAEEVADAQERLTLLRRVLVRSGFAARLVEGVDPRYMSDDHLRELGARYDKVMRIRLAAPRTGPGGPGELAWVWPVWGTALLLGWLLKRRRA